MATMVTCYDTIDPSGPSSFQFSVFDIAGGPLYVPGFKSSSLSIFLQNLHLIGDSKLVAMHEPHSDAFERGSYQLCLYIHGNLGVWPIED